MNTHSLDLESASSQYADRADAAGVSITGDLTIEAWIKGETFGGERAILGKYSTVSDKRSYLLEMTSSSQISFFNSSGGGTGTTTQKSVSWTPSTGVWYHVAVSYDASAGAVKFYVNGAQQGTTQTGAATSIHDNASRLAIGAYNTDGTPSAFFDGLIDDVRLWNDLRTDQEIADNYQAELVGNEANLVGYWKLNNDYLDSSGDGHHLTASGSPVFSTDVPFGSDVFVPRVVFF